MAGLLKSNPCRGCPTRICLHTCEDKKRWLSDAKQGKYPELNEIKNRQPRAFNLEAAIEALRITEEKTRTVRLELEAMRPEASA